MFFFEGWDWCQGKGYVVRLGFVGGAPLSAWRPVFPPPLTGDRCPLPAHFYHFADAYLSFGRNVCVLSRLYAFRLHFVCLGVFCLFAFFPCGLSMKVWHHVLGEGMFFEVAPMTPVAIFSFIFCVGLRSMVRFWPRESFYGHFESLWRVCSGSIVWRAWLSILVFMCLPMRFLVPHALIFGFQKVILQGMQFLFMWSCLCVLFRLWLPCLYGGQLSC